MAFGTFEFYRFHYWDLPDSPEPLIEQSLSQGEEVFNAFSADMVRDMSDLLADIVPLIEQSQNRQLIYRELERNNFWGVILYRNGAPWSWDGFHLFFPPPLSESTITPIRTYTQRRNNLSLLVAQSVFTINDHSYQLVAGRKLSQSSNLPIAPQVSFNLADHQNLSNLYPVRYSFSELPPENTTHYRVLSTSERDSVGIVYALQDDFPDYRATYSRNISYWHKFVHLVLYLTLLALFVIVAINYNSWRALLIQVIVLSSAWYATIHSGVIPSWAELLFVEAPPGKIMSGIQIGEYFVHALFMTLIFLITVKTFRRVTFLKTDRMQIRGVLFAFLYAVIQILLIQFFISATTELASSPAIPLLDLELIPPPISLIFYITGAVFITSISGIGITITHFLFRYERDKAVLIFLASFFSFLLTAFVIEQLSSPALFFGWPFFLTLFLFSVFLFGGWLLTYYPTFFSTMSGFRKMMILLILSSLSIYFIIWNTTTKRADNELLNVAVEYAAESESDGESLLRSILQTIEDRLQNTTESDIFENPDRTQAQFERIVETLVQRNWQSYTIDLHLIRSDGEMISDYSTSIDSPGWTSIFDLDLMMRSHRGEQLRMETNRPIIWGRPMNVGENFRSFFRGWIPIYSNQNPGRILAWVTGSIYQERPDFNKPIRALMAATSGDDWKKSFFMSEFAGNRVVRSATKGIYTDQPEYNRLSTIERDIALQDSVAFLTTRTSQGSFREILLKTGERNIVKVSTPKPGFNNHLFSFFRMFLPLFFFGLFVMGFLSVFGFKSFNLFSQSNRFQGRLIDGFTLATLLFLTVLMFATQYAISNQSEKNIERDLVNKLKNLGESIQLRVSEMDTTDIDFPLASVTTPLNVDAIFYRNVWVIESTTPQIFQQNLIPRILPFTAYEYLYNRERRHILSTVELADETLLVGYRAIVDEDNEPIAAVAIPTFTQSPVYTEQLLETTSYLFGIYLAIFILFTVGALVFSNQLTRPIEMIQKGLNKISRGERKTKIPVTSRDEVGALARAYNQMVNKLDEAQKELIKAERESAWKEMAQQVAHEIKNPLTPMKLNLQHLQRQLEANPDDVLKLKPAIERTAENIIEQIESLNKIASDFSKFSKPIREPFEPADLKNLIESVAGLYRNDDSIKVNVEFKNNTLVAHCIEDEIRRVLINLVKNGVEAGNGETSVINIEAGKRNNALYIKIQDNGQGIPPENEDNIFVPNFSTKSSGTGLGLAITKKIIEAHEGTISFDSTPGLGTTFTITLPQHHSGQ